MAGFIKGLMQNEKDKKEEKRKKSAHGKASRMFKSLTKKMAPKWGYHFHSDYFTIDDEYCRILTLFHQRGSARDLYPFWLCWVLPKVIHSNITVRMFTPIEVMSEEWVKRHKGMSEGAHQSQGDTAAKTADNDNINIYQNQSDDYKQISRDRLNGDNYLSMRIKLMIKAPTLEDLDAGQEELENALRSQQMFGGLHLDVYQGRQRNDFQSLFSNLGNRVGKPLMFTARELAGSYNLLTHGITDIAGYYVGLMDGELNDSAVIFNVDDYKSHVVVANKFHAATESSIALHQKFPDNVNGSALWGTKIAQTALLNGHRVVHLVLNGINPTKLGVNLDDITTSVPMNRGAINPFELFGKWDDEMDAYPMEVLKINLIAKQIDPEGLHGVDLNRNLNSILRRFYIDQKMLVNNARYNQDKLRLLGLPHDDYPLLQRFIVYLDTEYHAAEAKNNQLEMESIAKLQGVFAKLNNDNGSLFNVKTDPILDRTKTSLQVVYDFSSLIEKRGVDIAMAQFINAFSYATSDLVSGDVIIFHGTQLLSNTAKPYVRQVLDLLQGRGVRVAFLYDKIMSALNDIEFNNLPDANWTAFSCMNKVELKKYNDVLQKGMSQAFASQLTKTNEPTLTYLNRGVDNVIFKNDMILGDHLNGK